MIGRAIVAVLLVCVIHPGAWVAASQDEHTEVTHVTVHEPHQVTEVQPITVEDKEVIVNEKPIVVHEKSAIMHENERPIVVHEKSAVMHENERPIVVHEKPIVVHEKPIVVEEKPMFVEEKPQVLVDSTEIHSGTPIIISDTEHRFHADPDTSRVFGFQPGGEGLKCIRRKCSKSEKCIRKPEYNLAKNIKVQIGKLLEEYNRNIAAEYQRHKAAISGKTLDQYFYLGEKFNHACEYTSLQVDCPAGFVIEILSGFYGRQTNSVCYNNEIKNFKCSSESADGKIRSLCNNKQTCKLSSSNSVFSDPCVGTYKYAAVKYRCRLASSVQGFACEHSSLSISCPEKYEIEILHGFYGRETNDICQHKDVRNLRCRSGRGTEVIRSLCDNRQGCTVASSNSIFGDPCVGTYKYMTVNYRCRVSRSIRQQHEREKADMTRAHHLQLKTFEEHYIRQLGGYNHRLKEALIGSEDCIARKGPTCGSTRCQYKEKCVNIPAFKEVVELKAKISSLREQHNNNLVSTNSVFQSTIGSMTLDHLFLLGEKSAYACEYNSMEIVCPAGYVIELKSGFYGRKTNSICPNAEIKNFKCSSGDAGAKIRSLCDNKQSCKISSSNSLFGDPCVGTYKYATVKYRCRLATSIVLHACEHSSFSAKCPPDFEIEVLNGFYGRATNSICYNRDVRDFRCTSSRATDAMRSRCNNKQTCTVASSNSVFGDPCVGTNKYASITYRCRVSHALQRQHDLKRAEYSQSHNRRQKNLHDAFEAELQDLNHKLKAAQRGSQKCVPKRLGVECGLVRCSSSQSCVKVPATNEANIISAKMSDLRNEFNNNLASENKKYQASIGRKTLDHMNRLGERFSHSCEYTSMSIECPAGFLIEVLSGFYGRQTNSICYNNEIKNFKCSSGSADGKIRSLCNNRQTCKLSSSNSFFGDPCVGTYKYTAVRYSCRLATSVQLHACEHSSLSISCPANYEIEVLSGFYGRQTNSICQSRNVRDFKCSMRGATEVIRSLCNNRQECTVASSNSIFGDPCVGTFKYSTVTYRCRVSRQIQQRHDRERAEISRVHNNVVQKLTSDFNTQYGDLQHRLSAAQRGTDQCVAKAGSQDDE